MTLIHRILVVIIILVNYDKYEMVNTSDSVKDIVKSNQLDLEMIWSTNLTADFSNGQYGNYEFSPDHWLKTDVGLKLTSKDGLISSIPYNGNETIRLKIEVLHRLGTNSSITFGTRPSGRDTFDDVLVTKYDQIGSHRHSMKLFLLSGDRIQLAMTRNSKVNESTYIDSIHVTPMSSNKTEWKPYWTQDSWPPVAPLEVVKSKRLSDVAIVGIVVGVTVFVCGAVFGSLKYTK